MILKKLDIYIIKKFLGTFLFAISLIMSIAVVFDINEKLDTFLNTPLQAIVLDYYLNFIPYYANLFSPLFVFISVILFTSKMAENSEIIAILASGVSFGRLLRPYMISAAIIAGATFYLNSYLLPPATAKQFEFLNKYHKNKKVEYGSNIQLQAEPGVIAYFSRYDNSLKTGYRFSLERFEGKSLKSRLTANRIVYDSAHYWRVYDYLIRDFNGMREEITSGSVKDTVIAIEPSDFLISVYDSQLMTSPQLKEYINKQKERGVANIQSFEIEYERRLALAVTAFILTTIGATLSARKIKGGMGINLGIGLMLSFAYIMFNTISSTFAVSGLTTPFVAVWIPNLIFGIIALLLYFRVAPK